MRISVRSRTDCDRVKIKVTCHFDRGPDRYFHFFDIYDNFREIYRVSGLIGDTNFLNAVNILWYQCFDWLVFSRL